MGSQRHVTAYSRIKLVVCLRWNHIWWVLTGKVKGLWQKSAEPGFVYKSVHRQLKFCSRHLPSNILQLLQGDPEVFPGQMRYIIPPACSGSAPGSPTSWTCLENLQRKAPRRHPDQMPEPPQLAPFNAKERWLYSKLRISAQIQIRFWWVLAPTRVDPCLWFCLWYSRKGSQSAAGGRTVSGLGTSELPGIWMRLPPRLQGLPTPWRVVQVQEFLKVLFPPLDNIPSSGHQFSSPAEHSLDQALLSLPESSSGLSEFTWGQLKVLLHSLPELLPDSGFSFGDWSHNPSGLLVPVCWFRRPQPSPKGLLFQLQSLSPPVSTSRFSGWRHYRHQRLSDCNS